MAGGVLLLLGVFLPWYGTDASNRTRASTARRGTFSCWDVAPDPALAAARRRDRAVHPRLHHPPRPQAVLGARRDDGRRRHRRVRPARSTTAFVDRPGDPPARSSWGSVRRPARRSCSCSSASAKRSSETERPRKPPGVCRHLSRWTDRPGPPRPQPRARARPRDRGRRAGRGPPRRPGRQGGRRPGRRRRHAPRARHRPHGRRRRHRRGREGRGADALQRRADRRRLAAARSTSPSTRSRARR